MDREKIQFKVSSSLKSIIGKDLITNDFVAVFELVKNSIDAGASRVDVVFDLASDSPSIWIVDNGKGMSEENISKKWLFLGYSAKKEGVEDEYKKTYAGNKGVGRFSCDRLGEKLKIQSSIKGSKVVNVLEVNWADYEVDATQEFTNVDIFYHRSDQLIIPPILKPMKTGVAIEVSHLREPETWTRGKLVKLKRGLAKLVNPFGGGEQMVAIRVHCESEIEEDKRVKKKDEYPVMVNGLVENRILDVLEKKTASIEVIIKDDEVITELKDRGELIYKIAEPLSADLKVLEDENFRTTVYYLNQAAKSTFTRRMGIRPMAFGALFLFKNGFQVFPVGEEGNDYWGLDKRKAQGYSRFLGTRDIMGKVEVSGDESKFRESSSRDKGLVETEAVSALLTIIRDVIIRFERYVVGVTWQDRLDKELETSDRLHLDQNRARIIDLIAALSNSEDVRILDYNRNLVSVLGKKSARYEETLKPLRCLVEKIGDPKLSKQIDAAEKIITKARHDAKQSQKYAEKEAKAREEAEKIAKHAQEEAETATEAYEEERKRNLFLTRGEFLDKEMLESFLHQIDLYASNQKIAIDNHYKKILRSKSESVSREQTLDLISSLREGIDKISTTSRYATLANFRLKSGKVTSDVPDFIHEYLNKIAPLYHGEIEIAVTKGKGEMELTFSPIEFGMVLDNFISNARKARARKIVFCIAIHNKILNLQINDDGAGLSASIIEPEKSIFEKGFTRTKGSGLGLYFCREMIQRLGGAIKLASPQPEQGFGLTVKITG